MILHGINPVFWIKRLVPGEGRQAFGNPEHKQKLARVGTLAIDGELHGCDVVAVRVDCVVPNGYVLDRAAVRQNKTGRRVRFKKMDQAPVD